MKKNTVNKSRYVILASALMAASALSVWAGDPGDLFPDVSYDKAVSSPVARPDQTISTKQDTPVYVTPRAVVKPPVKEVVKTPVNPANPNPVKTPDAVKTPEVAKTPTGGIPDADLFTEKNPGYAVWGPYRLFTLKKFLSPAEQVEFDKDFAEAIKKALATTQKDRQIAIEALTDAADKRSPALKRYVLLNVVGLSIKNNNSLADRAERAMNVLPLLTEQTLETMQNKADCVYSLAMSAPTEANDTLWAMVVETESVLARLQVQCGFPKQALESLQKAKVAYARMYDKTAVRSELMQEASAWVAYADGANAQTARLKTILAEKPKDPDASNRVSMAYLVLYADLDAAEEYAVNAAKEPVKSLGATLHEMDFPKMGTEESQVVSHSLKIAEKVLGVAKAASEQLERYALAKLVVDRCDDLKEDFPKATDNNMASIREEASALMAANAYKPIPAVKPEPKPEPVAQTQNNNNNNNQNNNPLANFMRRLNNNNNGGGFGGTMRGGGGFGGRGGRGGR